MASGFSLDLNSLGGLLGLIGKLGPAVPLPGAGLVGELAVLAGKIIAFEKGQTGKSAKEICAENGVEINDEQARLLEDWAAEQAELDKTSGGG
jgi:hypothetical protein